MDEVKVQAVVGDDGTVTLMGLPFEKGERLDLRVRRSTPAAPVTSRTLLTARSLLSSGLIGMWKDRTDIGDSAAFTRALRETAQHRNRP